MVISIRLFREARLMEDGALRRTINGQSAQG
jgi:hypothetical protein